MDGAIVLHGLFLLFCHPNTQTCEIWVPHTTMGTSTVDVHQYTVGYGSDLVPLPQQHDLTKMMSISVAGTSNVFPFHPTTGNTPTFDAGQLVLKSSIAPIASDARDIISIPWPDEIFGQNRYVVYANSVAKTQSDQNVIESIPTSSGDPTDTHTYYTISDTVILHYKNVRQDPFTLHDETGKLIMTSDPVQTSSDGVTATTVTQAMIFYSEPRGCQVNGDHTRDLDNMIVASDNMTHQFVLTGNLAVSTGTDDTLDFELGNGLIEPNCQATLLKHKPTPKSTPSARRKARIEMNRTTTTFTGCGVVHGG